MKTIALKILVAGSMLLAIVSSRAQELVPTTITFDDLPEYGAGSITNGYDGLRWDNFLYLGGGMYEWFDPGDIRGFGYRNGIISPKNIALNAWAQPATVSSAAPFRLTSAYFTAAYRDGLEIRVQGYLGGMSKYDDVFTAEVSGPIFVLFNSALVDRVVFSSSGGTNHWGGFADGEHFALDNLSMLVPRHLPAVNSFRNPPSLPSKHNLQANEF